MIAKAVKQAIENGLGDDWVFYLLGSNLHFAFLRNRVACER